MRSLKPSRSEQPRRTIARPKPSARSSSERSTFFMLGRISRCAFPSSLCRKAELISRSPSLSSWIRTIITVILARDDGDEALQYFKAALDVIKTRGAVRSFSPSLHSV